MAKNLSDLSLLDILPSSIRDDYQVFAAAKALDPELQAVTRDIREALILSRIDELSESVVDVLAWQWHVDFYDIAKNLDMKREMVKGSIQWHRKKGTIWAIKKALEMIGIKSEVIEWWKIPGAAPYTFAVTAEITSSYWTMFPGATDATKAIRRMIYESKSTRSWLIRLDTIIKIELDHQLYTGIATMRSGKDVLNPAIPNLPAQRLYAGVATGRMGKEKIGVALPEIGVTRYFTGISTLTTSIITIDSA